MCTRTENRPDQATFSRTSCGFPSTPTAARHYYEHLTTAAEVVVF
jgi:hypothetical protein